jgi:threonine dehydrogenase-like Zn-dependent dehydrogenase
MCGGGAILDRASEEVGMRAAVYHGEGDIRVEDVDDPSILRPTDAIVRMTLAAVCGSDLHFYRHGASMGFAPGERVGHEFMGVVEEVGPEVGSVRPGDRVVASPSVADGTCDMCAMGLPYACRLGLGFFGFSSAFWHYGGEVQGGQSALVRAPFADYTLVRVPDALASPEHEPALLAVADVMGTGWHGAAVAGVAPGDAVVVIGDGAVGLCAAHAAVARGAEPVVIGGHHDDRLAVAERLGVHERLATRDHDEVAARVRELTGGQGARVVIASVSGAGPMALAHACVRAGGVISTIGLDQAVGSPPEVDWMDQFLRNVTITGGLVPGRVNMPALVEMLAEGRIDPSPVITHRLPLEQAPDAYRLMAERADGVIKVTLAH